MTATSLARTWTLIAAATGGVVIALVALGAAAQPGSAAPTAPSAVTPAPAQPPAVPMLPPPPPVWEYAALTHVLSTGAGTAGGRTSDWRFCSPGDDLAGEDALLAKFAGRVPAAQTDVAIINGLSLKGWELVTHSQSATYEAKLHNGTTSGDNRVTSEQWWFKREKPKAKQP